MRWTQDQDCKLKAMYDADTPASVISSLIGRSVKAVYKRASIKGLTSPERSQSRAKNQNRDVIGIAYKRGKDHRGRDRPCVSPSELMPVQRAYWLAGWHDKDMEMGHSILEGSAS